MQITVHKCDMETWNLQRSYTENGIFSEVEDILCPVVEHTSMFIDSVLIFNKGAEQDVHLRIIN